LGRLTALLFFAGPAVLVALAVSLRTGRIVESYAAVMDRVREHAAAARAASDGEGVELPLLLAVASAESGGRADARSAAGAAGLMQLMPATARELASSLGEPRPDVWDPATSLRLGARYLRRQLDRFSDSPCAKELAIAAYNAGPEKVAEWRRTEGDPAPGSVVEWIRFGETRAFVRRVLDYEARWRPADDAAPAR
jgi:soluble lytic murein transglycosylase-like protein